MENIVIFDIIVKIAFFTFFLMGLISIVLEIKKIRELLEEIKKEQ